MAPILPPAGFRRTSCETTYLCQAWLAKTAEIEHEQIRWGQLESRLAEQFNWYLLTEREQRSIGRAHELFEIEAKLDRLTAERDAQLDALLPLAAKDLVGVAAKIAVAVKLASPEDQMGLHALLTGLYCDLMTLAGAGPEE